MSGDTETENKVSTDAITETSLDLSPGITEDDKILWRKDKNAVEFSLNYAKLWCKFCKELVVALEKKANIEIEMCRSWSKQFLSFESTISSNAMIGAPMRPLSLLMSKLIIEQCKEIETQHTKKLGKLLDVISRQRTEFSKTRKLYKEKWKSDCKKMMDAENSMLKTKAAYYQRCQQGVKLREELANAQALLTLMQDHGIQDSGSFLVTSPMNATNTSNNSNFIDNLGTTSSSSASSNAMQNDPISTSQLSKQKLKVDKLEKQLTDNDKKEIEMMHAYKESVESANNKLIEFERKKMEHLCDIRLTTSRSDEIVKDTLAEYLKILAETRIIMLNEYADLSKNIQDYKPCQEYRCLIDKQMSNKPDVYSEKFQVELFHDYLTSKEKHKFGHFKRTDSQLAKGISRFNSGIMKDIDHDSSRGNRNILPSHSDSDSETEVVVVDGTSALTSNRTGVLNTIVEFGSNLFRQGGAGYSANVYNETNRRNQSNKIKKSTSGSTSSMPGCGDVISEKELEWQKEVDSVLEIILKCIEIIELNGLSTQGIYRISASKLKVGSVMESFNNHEDHIDLLSEQPITLANVVKSKLISLSEPLIPYNLYNEFVDLGKEAEAGEVYDLDNKLKALIVQLPPCNKKLAGLVFHHLKKVANNSEENQMGSTNLGTLFAPTLIKAKPRFRLADIKEYMDNKSQAKIVQIIIENVEELFGPEEQYYAIRSSKDENGDHDDMKLIQDKEIMKIIMDNAEVVDKNKINLQSSQGSNKENSLVFSLASDSNANQSMSSGLKVQNSSQSAATSSISNKSDKPSPKMMDLLMKMDTTTKRSVSPRQKMIFSETSVEKLKSDVSATDKNSQSFTSRSISMGPTPFPESIKLAQLSKPSIDSIFSKFKDLDDDIISEEPASRSYRSSNELKRSFISSADSYKLSHKNDDSKTVSVDQDIKTSNAMLNRSRPASATARSSHSFLSSDLPVLKINEQIEHSSLQTISSFYSIPETASTRSSSTLYNHNNSLRFTEIIPRKQKRYRSKSSVTLTERTDKILIRRPSWGVSPFVRQSKIRVPLSTKSLIDFPTTNPSVNSTSPVSSSRDQCNNRDKFLNKFCSVDDVNTVMITKIIKYQDWLAKPVVDEFYV